MKLTSVLMVKEKTVVPSFDIPLCGHPCENGSICNIVTDLGRRDAVRSRSDVFKSPGSVPATYQVLTRLVVVISLERFVYSFHYSQPFPSCHLIHVIQRKVIEVLRSSQYTPFCNICKSIFPAGGLRCLMNELVSLFPCDIELQLRFPLRRRWYSYFLAFV